MSNFEKSEATAKVEKAKKVKEHAPKSKKGNIFVRVGKAIKSFIKDFRGETKKIVWPGLRDVVKNGIIVLIMCGIVGIFIWLVDFGLGSLMELITKL